MAYSSFAYFQGIPALHAPLLPRPRQRRTATGIMAGRFDPLPAFASDFGKDDSGSSHESIMTFSEEEDVLESVLVGSGRGKNTVRKSLGSTKARKDVVVRRVKGGSIGNGKQVRRVVPEDKENALSDSETGTSLSPVPVASAQLAPPSIDMCNKALRASGFWLARSSNTPEGSLSAMKRKHSSIFDEGDSSPPPDQRAAKKSRHSEPVALRTAGVLSSSSESLTSLDGDLQDASPEVSYSERLDKAHLPHTPLGGRESPERPHCQICPRQFDSPCEVESHYKIIHPDYDGDLENPFDKKVRRESRSISVPAKNPQEDRKRGVRKNVAVKKGWKGWVEEDLEPQKLILLDKPEVLPERTTRSGRKID